MTLTEAALRYGELGLRVFPLVPGTKKPLVSKWPIEASRDRDKIRQWWQQTPDAGIGLACGDELAAGRFLFVLDLDRHDGGADGVEAWNDLDTAHGAPDAPEVLTPSDGRHLYFTSPEPLTNARGALPDGIDVRGRGGFVILPPTTLPNGDYVHEVEHSLGSLRIPRAPEWLLKLLAPPEPPDARETATRHVSGAPDVYDELDDRPGTEWARLTDWKTLLEADGWTYCGTGGSDEDLWTRPGKLVKDGPSATTNYGWADRLVIHSTNAPLPPGSYSKLGYLAETRFGGDYSAAARSIKSSTSTPSNPTPPTNVDAATGEILPEPDEDTGVEDWARIDVADIARKILSGEYEQEVPVLLEVRDALPLLYPGRTHSIFGPPGGGKTWIALAAIAERLHYGENVLFVDFEDSAAGTVQRLLKLGVTVEELERFDYRSVSTSLLYGWATLELSTIDYSLVVIDSTGEALAAQGINPNDDGEVAGWFSLVKHFRLRDVSPCVLLLDHVPKNADNPHGAPIGSQRKLAAVTGAAYRCDTLIEPARGKAGKLKLVVAKDRLGYRPKGSPAAEVDIHDVNPDRIELTFAVTEIMAALARGEKPRKTHIMHEISAWLQGQPGDVSKNAIVNAPKGPKGEKRKNTDVVDALQTLIEEGHVEQSQSGQALIHNLVKPFNEEDDRYGEPF